VATTAWLAGVDPRMESALEIAPPHWIGDDELMELERRFEPLMFERFADGTLLVSPPVGGLGGMRSGRLSARVIGWAESSKLGVAFGEATGFKFPGDALLSPDATYVTRERWEAVPRSEREGFPVLVPDAAFEMISKSDSVRATRRKVGVYLQHGVRLVVLIDPYRNHTYVGRTGDPDAVDLGDVATVDCSPVMPGFVLDIATILDVA
jgi:Uma2 family endonuclease